MITKDIVRVYNEYGDRYFGTPPTEHGPGKNKIRIATSLSPAFGKVYKIKNNWQFTWTANPTEGIIGTTPLGFI